MRIWDIADKPPELLEVRICIHNCENIKMADIEGTSDVFIRSFFDSKGETLETDTHYRCQDGKPDFQYRLVYKMSYPSKSYKLTLQCYDRDLLKSNDILGECSLDI